MTDQPQESSSRSPYIIGGAAVVALGIAVLLFNGKSSENTACALTTTGIVTISEGLTKGHSTSTIMAKGALAGTVPGVCKAVVASFVEEPETETDFRFASSEGELEESASGYELTESIAAPPEESIDSERIIDCFRSYGGSEFLYRMCVDEVISPAA